LRRVVLTHTFRRSQQHHAPAGTPEGRAVARILNQFTDEAVPLPGPHDREDIIAPNRQCMARPIPSAGLLVCYVIKDAVYVVAVKPI
jgi:hypothetical protein